MNYLQINEITLNAAAKAAARYIMNETPGFCDVEKDQDGEAVAATVYIAFSPSSGVVGAEAEYLPDVLAVRVEIIADEALRDFKQRLRDAITAALLEKYGDDEKSVIRYGSTLYAMTRDDMKRAEKNGFDLYPDTDGGRRWYVAQNIAAEDFGNDSAAALDALDAAEDAWNGLDVYAFCGRGYRVEFWQCGL